MVPIELREHQNEVASVIFWIYSIAGLELELRSGIKAIPIGMDLRATRAECRSDYQATNRK